MQNKFQKSFIYLTVLFLIILCFLRFVNLGYSEFQGDEISAQNYLFDHQNLWQFLMTRTIGPMQYLVTFAVNFLVFERVSNLEFWVRLPFALASVFSVIGVFVMVRKYFGLFEALGSSILIAGSGLLFAFSRFAQYQSFVICLGIWVMHLFLSSSKKDASPKSLILPSILSAIALLFHYDALTFIIPIYFILFFEEFPKFREKKNAFFKTLFKSKIWYFSFPLFFITSLFYLPYVFNPKFISTLNYLFLERISSDTKFDAVFYSSQILSLYHPTLFLIFILFFVTFFIIFNFNKLTTIQKSLLSTFLLLIVLRFTFVNQNQILTFASFFSFILLIFSLKDLIFQQPSHKRNLTLWFIFSFSIYGLLISKPMTHIYTFLLPFFILLPIYIVNFWNKSIYFLVITLISIFLLSYNFFAFIDTKLEFPWNSKTFLLEKKISIYEYSFRFDGVFGFPYYRSWNEIAVYLKEKNLRRYFSNEKYRLTKYYLRDFNYDEISPEVYIHIKNPQSLTKSSPPTNWEILHETLNYSIFQNPTAEVLKLH